MNIISFITIPVAYLRPPFYSASTQAYLNYGGLGVDAEFLFSYGVDNLMLSIKSTLYRPEELIRRTASVQTLEQFRVIGSFQNLPEFSQDFKCNLGSFMSPVEKCPIF